MLKKILIPVAAACLLISLFIAVGCGSGDAGGVGRVSTTEMVTHSGDTDGSGPGPNPGGGGGPGACVWDSFNVCYEGYSQSTCQVFGTYTPNVTCQSLGYGNCSTYSGYTVCL